VNAYKPGQSIRFTVTSTLLGVLTTPPTVVLTIRGPDDSRLTPTPVVDSVGQFHADAVIPLGAPAGVWVARWQATGGAPSNNALVETRFVVAALDF
jgi:hypothetical protein